MLRPAPIVVLALAAVASSTRAQESFSIVLLPDTQFYCETPSWFYQFTDQTRWILDAQEQRNIAFVSHLGDIVQNGGASSGNTPEWLRATQALAPLNNVLPYSVCLGNHDYEVVSNKASGSATYQAYFGSSRYSGRPWYGGHRNNQSHYQVFEAGGRQWLHLTLEWRPDANVLDWAENIINSHAEMPVLVSTHEHVRDPGSNGTGAGRSTAGQFTWDNLLLNNPRIIAIFNGHFHSGPALTGGEYSQTGVNSASTETMEILTDYQRRPQGGSGWLRILQVDERNHQIRFLTYSPSLQRFETDWNSQFVSAFDLAHRLDSSALPAVSQRTFRNGVDSYQGTVDTELRQNPADASSSRGSGASMIVDTDEPNGSGMDSQSLIRFDSIIGTAPGQIPADADVVHAAVRLKVTNPGAGLTLHRLRTPWSEAASTWNSLGVGVAPDGVESFAAPESSAGTNDSNNNVGIVWVDFDVTSSLRAYLHGAPNHGWALLPYVDGANAITFATSESPLVEDRPQLIVTLPTGSVTTTSFQQGVSSYSSAIDIELQQSNPIAPVANAPTLAIGSDEPVASGLDRQVLLRFDSLFEPGSLDADAFVTSATLVLEVTDPGSGFSLHRMISPWNSTSSWSAFAANGVQADDEEAWLFAEQHAGADAANASVSSGSLMLDVTESVRAWQQGATNLGWVLRPFPGASNTLRIASSEHPSAAIRPRLVVKYVPAPLPTCDAIDFNRDGLFPDEQDLIDFLSVLAGGTCSTDPSPGCGDIDFNNDGLFPDTADLVAFLNVLSGGDCL